MQGALRFVQRLWRLVGEAAEIGQTAPADAAGGRSARRPWRCARPPMARSRRSPTRIEKLHFNVCVAHIYEFANALIAAVDESAANGGVTPDFAWAIKEASRHPGAAVPPDDAASGRGMLGRARPQRRRLVAEQAWPEVEPGC